MPVDADPPDTPGAVNQAVHNAAVAKSGWRKVADFPLVTLGLAGLSLVSALSLVGMLIEVLPLELVLHRLPKWIDPIIVSLALVSVAVLVYKLWIVRLGERPRDDLPFDARVADAGKGILLALLLMSAIVGLAALLGGYRISGWGGSRSLAFLLFTAGLQAAVVEELLLRGVLFRWLEELGGSWFALASSSALFGFLHAGNPNATVLASLAIALGAGVLLGGAYMLARNLWLAIGLHFGWNFTQGYLWDVPVSGFDVDGLVAARPTGDAIISGGSFGLEASLPALVLATGLGVWFVVHAARRGNIVQSWWTRRRMVRAAPKA